MSKYKETRLVGSEYQRSRLVSINNPLIGEKSITFTEEKIKSFGDDTIAHDIGNLKAVFNESTAFEKFDLLNPDSNQKVGEARYMDIYILLYSLYMHLAKERDSFN